jgi:hypothetical protein
MIGSPTETYVKNGIKAHAMMQFIYCTVGWRVGFNKAATKCTYYQHDNQHI